MAFDTAINKMVLFGIDNSNKGTTWTYDGTTWTRQSPATSPWVTQGAMGYDAALAKVVLFGSNGTDAVTWTYDGTTWTRQSPATSPPPLADASMTFDPHADKLVLFGGDQGSQPRADTWTYDGTTWMHQSTATSPPARRGAAMAFDPASGDIVLFGGGTPDSGCEGSQFDDTWTYDGTNWTSQSPAISPPSREEAPMVDDPATGGLVLFGGRLGLGPSSGCRLPRTLGDTWTYSGGAWRQLAPSTSPTRRSDAAAAYDGQTRQVLLFGGGSTFGGLQNDVWALQIAGTGYRFVASDGGVFTFDAPFHGSTGNIRLNQPIVGMAADTGTGGYWLVASDGGVFTFDAPYRGSTGNIHLNRPIVGMGADPATGGYWLVASDGGVFAFDAAFFGSVQSLTPIVGMAVVSDSQGYWLAAVDGTVYRCGPFGRCSAAHGVRQLNAPIVGIAADPATGGYWLVASDGGVFAFDAPYYGSTGGMHLNQPIVGMAAAPDGQGYWLVAKDGGVFTFGPGAIFHGSTGDIHLNQPIVGMTGS